MPAARVASAIRRATPHGIDGWCCVGCVIVMSWTNEAVDPSCPRSAGYTRYSAESVVSACARRAFLRYWNAAKSADWVVVSVMLWRTRYRLKRTKLLRYALPPSFSGLRRASMPALSTLRQWKLAPVQSSQMSCHCPTKVSKRCKTVIDNICWFQMR